ncbi:hypothetical protein C8R44DRAFT_880859 [Mycena epipterygia]|nr:hypothetical protein C8R44DRAFT_880859 [Mycena epipterygia]
MANKKAPPKPPRKSCSKKLQTNDDASSDIEEVSQPATKSQRVQVNWMKNLRWTDRMVQYLCENPTFRMKLFSDSTAEDKKEKRAKQRQGGPMWNTGEYATSVETCLRRLKKDYQKLLERIGATGAGLNPSHIRVGSNLASIFDEVREEFPWWDDLHAFWRELPNYNPIGVQSSEPGTDHAGAAAQLFDHPASGDGDEPEELDELDDDRSEVQDLLEDIGGDDKSHASLSDDDDDELYVLPKGSDISESTPVPAKLPKQTNSKPKAPVAVSGRCRRTEFGSGERRPAVQPALPQRDLGLAKANVSKSSVAAKKKPQNAIDRLNDLRESESARFSEKRKFQHTEEMERIKLKKLKLELKMLQAKNERTRLNRHATSQSPHRRSRVLNIGSPSPSKSRSTHYVAASPRHVRHVNFHPVPSYTSTSGDGGQGEIDDAALAFHSNFDGDLSTSGAMDFNFSSIASTSSVDWSLPLGIRTVPYVYGYGGLLAADGTVRITYVYGTVRSTGSLSGCNQSMWGIGMMDSVISYDAKPLRTNSNPVGQV